MYDKFPFVPAGDASECSAGWQQIADRIAQPAILCVECYPGIFLNEVHNGLASRLTIAYTIFTEELLLEPAEIERKLAPYLTDDPVFGRMNQLSIRDFFDPAKLAAVRERVVAHASSGVLGTLFVLGTGASLVCDDLALLVYADLARWEIQLRQRCNEIGNLGADNFDERPSLKYKRAFFIDWRAADYLKRELFPKIDFLL